MTNDNYAVIDLNNNGNIQEANNGIFEVTKTGLNRPPLSPTPLVKA